MKDNENSGLVEQFITVFAISFTVTFALLMLLG